MSDGTVRGWDTGAASQYFNSVGGEGGVTEDIQIIEILANQLCHAFHHSLLFIHTHALTSYFIHFRAIIIV
jgi:hypothetical protein